MHLAVRRHRIRVAPVQGLRGRAGLAACSRALAIVSRTRLSDQTVGLGDMARSVRIAGRQGPASLTGPRTRRFVAFKAVQRRAGLLL